MPKNRQSDAKSPALFELVHEGYAHPVTNDCSKPQLHYENANGKLFFGDSLEWLKSIPSNSIELIFADPPYNINKAEWDSFESQEAYIEWSLKWILEASRILKKSGSMYVCGFSEILSDIKYCSSKHFHSCRWLVWHYKNKANLGKDWGRSHESIIHFRKSKDFELRIDNVRIAYGSHTLKYPSHPQALTSNFGKGAPPKDNWTPHPLGAKPKDVIEIPTTCNGMEEKTPHPTQKPEELVRKLILAASDESSLVLDPFSGSGTTATVSEQLGRKWLACDISLEYNQWAVERIENARKMSEQEWVDFDRKNAERRESIR